MSLLNSYLYLDDFKHKKNLDLVNKLWVAIMSMDIIEVFSVLPEDINFYELDKEQFIKELDLKFKKHRVINDEAFYLNLIQCHTCHNDEITCQFVGTESGINLHIYFHLENGLLKGLHFCHSYGGVEDLDAYYDWNEI